MPPRCPKGSRRNKKTGECEKTGSATKKTSAKRCPKGTRRNKKSGVCESTRMKTPTPPHRSLTPMRMPTPPQSPPKRKSKRAQTMTIILQLNGNVTDKGLDQLKDILCEDLYYDVHGECSSMKKLKNNRIELKLKEDKDYMDEGMFTEEEARNGLEADYRPRLKNLFKDLPANASCFSVESVVVK